MGPRKASESASRKAAASKASSSRGGTSAKASNSPSSSSKKKSGIPPSAGYLITCDVPTKQYILHLNETKSVDKKFIIENLDTTHLLVKKKARAEIERKVESWMDENVFSAVERVGEDLDIS